jgi:hypothetical protein
MVCGEVKYATEFYVRNKKTMTRHSSCKECDKNRVKKRHELNPERTRNNDLLRNYGISLDDHTNMFEKQKGLCAICGKEGDGRWKKLCVDHCHSTGKVRELLCRNCNMMLGQVGDNRGLLLEMVSYLDRHSDNRPCPSP